MKRRLSPDAQAGNGRRRQPQTSCDFCRTKKLKCDRGEPCSNCVARGVACRIEGVDVQGADHHHHHHPAGSGKLAREQLPVVDADVLQRLRQLEEAVFGRANGHADGEKQARLYAGTNLLALRRPEPLGGGGAAEGGGGNLVRRRSVRGKELDYALSSNGLASDHSTALLIRVLPARHLTHTPSSTTTPHTPSMSSSSASTSLDPSYGPAADPSPRHIWLPARADAIALFTAYASSMHHIQHRGYTPATRTMLADVYSRLAHTQPVDLGCVALLLAICAAAAYYWDPRLDRQDRKDRQDPLQAAGHYATAFDGHDDAARQSLAWRKAAWDVLQHAARATAECGSSLEGVQAYMILGDLVYNTEGCSARWRGLQYAALAMAREIGLHLVDLPGGGGTDGSSSRDGPGKEQESLTLREVKRRVWWYVAGTDWLLATMGGPTDRTYTIHPSHFVVRPPRELNDDELAVCDDTSTPAHPPGAPTHSSYLNARLRLAELCRHVADLLPLGGVGDLDDLPFDAVLALDTRIQDALHALPARFCTLDAPLPEAEAYPPFRSQRRVLHMSYHARRAKLFRPFLEPRSWAVDPRKKRFRGACRESAHTVLALASGLLEESLGPPGQTAGGGGGGGLAAHLSGTIINHLFMACAVLATDPALRANPNPNPGDGTAEPDAANDASNDAEATKAALTRACQLLERAGEQSGMAACMLRRLVLVLDRYRVGGVEASAAESAAAAGARRVGVALVAAGNGGWDRDSEKGSAGQEDGMAAGAATGAENWNKGGIGDASTHSSYYASQEAQTQAQQYGAVPPGMPPPMVSQPGAGGGVDATATFGIQPGPWSYTDPTGLAAPADGFGLTGLWDDLMSAPAPPLQQDSRDIWGQMINELDFWGAPV